MLSPAQYWVRKKRDLGIKHILIIVPTAESERNEGGKLLLKQYEYPFTAYWSRDAPTV